MYDGISSEVFGTAVYLESYAHDVDDESQSSVLGNIT
jgi:hypothetical protein